MTPEARRAWPRVAWLCGLSVIAALSAPSQAQTAPQGPPAQASAYQDRYIAGGTLSPDISTGDYGTSEASGLARSIRTDSGGASLIRKVLTLRRAPTKTACSRARNGTLSRT